MDVVVIDVREPDEYASGHIVSSINIPLGSLLNDDKFLKNIPKDANLIVYCRTGNRSRTAVTLLHRLGYQNVINGINQEQIRNRSYL